jgi:hypothetical protein
LSASVVSLPVAGAVGAAGSAGAASARVGVAAGGISIGVGSPAGGAASAGDGVAVGGARMASAAGMVRRLPASRRAGSPSMNAFGLARWMADITSSRSAPLGRTRRAIDHRVDPGGTGPHAAPALGAPTFANGLARGRGAAGWMTVATPVAGGDQVAVGVAAAGAPTGSSNTV